MQPATNDRVIPVVVFENAESDVRAAREERLSDALFLLEREFNKALKFEPLMVAHYDGDNVKALREDELHARFRLMQYFRKEVERYRKLLRRTLASDSLTDSDRAAVLQGLHGVRGRKIDARVFTDSERKLVDDYRKLGDSDRQMVRRLFDRLAVPPETLTPKVTP